MKRFLVLAAVSAAAFTPGLTGPARAQTLPPSLEGENFVATMVTSSFSGCPTQPGEQQTVSFHAEGLAFGPYSGTFTEDGTVAVRNIGAPSFFEEGSFQSSFTIRDATQRIVVRGSKTGPQTANVGPVCLDLLGDELLDNFGESVSYEATITPAGGGTFGDSGEAFVSFAFFKVMTERNFFGEGFFLSNGVLPLDTTGKATGGGQLGDFARPAHITFGFEVKQPQLGKLHGHCLVNDSASKTRVKCLDVTSYSQIGNTATWTGHAQVNGVGQDYRITVQDNGEPNQGVDTFTFDSAAYSVSGNVEHGNIQLHRQTTP